jgi:hypothetical protein
LVRSFLRTQDRFLLVVLSAVGLLVLVALSLFFIRQRGQTYGEESTPAGVVRNYLLALQQQDYERAYSYLAEDSDAPDFDTFRIDTIGRVDAIDRLAVDVGEAEQTGADAQVELEIVSPAGGPFDPASRSPGVARLAQDAGGAWKIVSVPYPYWDGSWPNNLTR